ncbi:MAG TPA: cytochrome P460 family protein [Pseudobdellovibrionaceae bacterium]|nr:cytochrome P460 family protein [Pseudobdellovibrionaceae bacterium]
MPWGHAEVGGVSMSRVYISSSQDCFVRVLATTLVSFWFSLSASAAATSQQELLQSFQEPPDEFAGRLVMNGIEYEKFKDFLSWPLVTVRYRHEINELRFTYANKLAQEALAKGAKEYPKGAAFVKVGYITKEDPAFASSAIPAGPMRVQIMLRDSKSYADTDGWGYALFNSDGRTLNGDPKVRAMACAACHRLVPDRGYVFSQMMKHEPFELAVKAMLQESSAAASGQSGSGLAGSGKPISTDTGRVKFEDLDIKKVPRTSLLWNFIREGKTPRSLVGELRKHSFGGTFNEILPTLVKEVKRSKRPALLASDDFFRFALVRQAGGVVAKASREKRESPCQAPQEPYLLIYTRETKTPAPIGQVNRRTTFEEVRACF